MLMKASLIHNPERPLPDTYHSRLGLKLDPAKSKVYKEIDNIRSYANMNEMKLNVRKCKFILFNPTLKYDFVPELEIEGSKVETAEEIGQLAKS